ncbi:MAG: hypothetical protein FP824_01095 [Euryarchaeota archaeon]|nr:hypothetical protein [Euryarchaeota archaeon]
MDELPRFAVSLKVEQDIHYSIISELLNRQGILCERWSEDAEYSCTIGQDVEFQIEEIEAHFERLAGISDQLYIEDKLSSVPLDDFAENLAESVKQFLFGKGLPYVRIANWPNFEPACAIITHDIDTLNNPPAGKGVEFAKYAMTRKVKKQPYNDNIQNIKDIENKHGINASFYFFPDYGKHQAHFKTILGQLDKKDEIALHGTQHSFQSAATLEKEKKELENITGIKIVGTRQHGLNFMVPHTWRYQEKAGLEYDLTHSYNDKFGFRAGTCLPFHPFDSLIKERFDILELPTSYMDWTALHHGMDYSAMMMKIKELCAVVEQHNGVFIPIFHNMYINEKSHPDVTKSFDDTTKYLKEKKYWITTARECTAWWKKRENVKLDISFDSNALTVNSDTRIPIEIFYPDGKIKRVIVESGKKTEIIND